MIDPDALDWDKMGGLIPAVVQDHVTGQVRMLGYMDRAALASTLERGVVTFYSRSRQRLWTKGESSGNSLSLIAVHADCDADSLLILATPKGPTCHLGSLSCFGDEALPQAAFLDRLEHIQAERSSADPVHSYTARLLAGGVKRIAQKVGEEGVETALAAVAGEPAELTSEAADLLYHLLLLLRARGSSLEQVMAELQRRHSDSKATASS